MNIEYRSLELKFISSKFRISSSFSFDVSEKAEHEPHYVINISQETTNLPMYV